MTRDEVYEILDGEREYQEREMADPTRKDMVTDFDMSKALLAIHYTLDKAVKAWYNESPELGYDGTSEYLRKIGGIVVQMGELYGMPERTTKKS